MSLLPETFNWFPVFLSLKVALFASLIALLLGVGLGWLLARKNFFGRGLLEAILMLPLVLPPTVVGYAILVLGGRQSALGGWLYRYFDYSIIFNWHGAVIASSVVALPLILKTATVAFRNTDKTLEAASFTLGQSRFSTFIRITLPLAWPAILGGCLLAFARAMGEFGATLMVAGSIPGKTETLSMAIYNASQSGQDSLALSYVAIAAVVSISILLISNRYLERNTATPL